MFIHTFETTIQLTNGQYYQIQNQIKSDHQWGRTQNGMLYFGAKNDGIRLRFTRIHKSKFKGYRLKYIISARRVLEPENYVGLFPAHEYKRLCDAIDKKLAALCPALPSINECSVTRIDFCINARLDNQEQVKAYVKLAKRCRLPKSLEFEREYYDKKDKKTKLCKDGMTASSESYIAISIYNKYAQMCKQTGYAYPAGQLDKAKNILRIEIRCMEDKIKHLRKRYQEQFALYSIKDFLRHADEIGDYLYSYYLGKMFCNGDFYTLKGARKRVKMGELDKETEEAMLDLLEEANGSRSLQKACSLFAHAYSKKYVKRLLAKFDLIITSPVTVPREIQKIFGDEQIPHPLMLASEWKDNPVETNAGQTDAR